MTADRLELAAARYHAAWLRWHVNQFAADDATRDAMNDQLTAAEEALFDAALALHGVEC
jgi:hypothetical protein